MPSWALNGVLIPAGDRSSTAACTLVGRLNGLSRPLVMSQERICGHQEVTGAFDDLNTGSDILDKILYRGIVSDSHPAEIEH